MSQLLESQADRAAMLLALMVAPCGSLDPRDLAALDRQGAFERLGMPRARFLELADRALTRLGGAAGEHSWLDERARSYLDGLLAALVDPRQRRSICELAAEILAADEGPGRVEPLVYHHVLAHWHIDPGAAGR